MHETELFALERIQFERRHRRRSGIYIYYYIIYVYGPPDDGGVPEWRAVWVCVSVGVWVSEWVGGRKVEEQM